MADQETPVTEGAEVADVQAEQTALDAVTPAPEAQPTPTTTEAAPAVEEQP